MEIYALIGQSGTGKSHHAPILAAKHNIELIIDDGLLIKGNINLAGRSAKRESTRYGAIKRAVFKDPEHAQQVRKKLEELRPNKVLILGTSRRMAEVIAENLGLPKPTFIYLIEEVSDPDSIKKALAIRAEDNRHVIPLPTFAIKKEFPGYIIDPLHTFFSFPSTKTADVPTERSVIRPIFSNLGNFYIAEHVITDLAKYLISDMPGIYKILDVELENGRSKVVLEIDLAIDLACLPEMRLDKLLHEIQRTIKEEVEYRTGFYLDEVNVHAKKLHMDEKNIKDKDTLRQLISASRKK